jgi:hypothetical protein
MLLTRHLETMKLGTHASSVLLHEGEEHAGSVRTQESSEEDLEWRGA